MKQRIYYIDIARALAILGVVAIHTYSYHLTNSHNFFIWNWLQFVVVTFVFCSGFVLKPLTSVSLQIILRWFKKRFMRLYLPFLIYFPIHYSLFLLSPSLFHNLGMQKSFSYFFQSLLLLGGLNTGWLPLLFLELMIITPLLFIPLLKKVVIMVSLFFTVGITFFYHFPYVYYRWVMWIPWILIYFIGFYFSQKKMLWYMMGFGATIGIFGACYFFIAPTHHLVFLDNKYPPNLYFLSYGLSGTFLLLLLAKIAEKIEFAKQIGLFISSISYQLFFLHFIVLDLVELLQLKSIITETLLVISISLFLLGGITFGKKFLRDTSD